MKKFIFSFKNALNGIYLLIRDERNAKIHVMAIILVVITGIIFDINRFEWCFIALAISLVLITETINTVIENMIDFITLERKPELKKIKDIAAGSVLIAALFAVIIAGIIFLPKFF